jgi:hypothetical protein
MTTLAQAREGEVSARQQRMALARLLMVDETTASPADLALCAKVRAAVADPAQYDRALAEPAVNSLFARGVLHFGGAMTW